MKKSEVFDKIIQVESYMFNLENRVNNHDDKLKEIIDNKIYNFNDKYNFENLHKRLEKAEKYLAKFIADEESKKDNSNVSCEIKESIFIDGKFYIKDKDYIFKNRNNESKTIQLNNYDKINNTLKIYVYDFVNYIYHDYYYSPFAFIAAFTLI